MSSCSAICEIIESTMPASPASPASPKMSAQFKVIIPDEDIAEQAFGPIAVEPIAPFAPVKSVLAPLQSLQSLQLQEELKPVAKKLIFEEEPTWGWNGIPLDTTIKDRGAFQSPRPHFPRPCALVRSSNEDTPDASPKEPKEPEESEEPEPNFNDIPPPPPVLRRTDTISCYANVNPGTPVILRANSVLDSSSCISLPPKYERTVSIGSYEWDESYPNGPYPWSRVDSSSCTY